MEIEINYPFRICDLDIDTIKLKINEVVLDLSNYLDLTTLESIIIPNDFGEDIVNFQREHGLIEGYTKHNSGYVGGKTLYYILNGYFKQTVFLNQKAFEDPAVRFCLLNHELCHVHDNYMQFKMGIKDIPELAKNSQHEGILKEAYLIWAGGIWAEYIANRLSAKQAVGDESNCRYNLDFIAGDIELFSLRLETTEKEITSQINVSRASGDWSTLFPIARDGVIQLLRAAGRVNGHVHGIAEFSPEGGNKFRKCICDEIIKQSYFENIWPELEHALLALYDNYPRWCGSEELCNLVNIVEMTWNALGVYTKEIDGGRIWVGSC